MNTINTKEEIALGLKRCLSNMNIEKVTVRDICNVTGISRQTFYRHFSDKYNVLSWYFDIILKASFEHMGKGSTLYDALVKKFTYIKEERLLFKAAFKLDSQNNLKDHDFDMIYDFYKTRLNNDLNENLDFLLRMYCKGSVEMTVDWLINDSNKNEKELAQDMIDALPLKLYDKFKELNFI